jgi:hypothetical protein
MRGERSVRDESAEMSRVDDLLGLIEKLSEREPSAALRAHLKDQYSRRLQQNLMVRDTQARTFNWHRAAFATVLLAALGLTIVSIVHLRQHKNMHAGKELTGVSSPVSPSKEVSVSLPIPLYTRRYHSRSKPPPASSDREMVIPLPYSNSFVDTGTGATIQVSISQSELLSLGFPLNATLHDQRVVAELTLGDDGLPRAISLPLPLELIKEEK